MIIIIVNVTLHVKVVRISDLFWINKWIVKWVVVVREGGFQ